MPLEPNADIAGPGACFSVFVWWDGSGWLVCTGFDIVYYAGQYGSVYLAGYAGS